MTHKCKLAVASTVHGHKIRHKSASGACCVDRQLINIQTCHADSLLQDPPQARLLNPSGGLF